MEIEEGDKIQTIGTKKTIGFFGAYSIVVGCIVGSGIFMTVGDTMTASPKSVGLLMVYWIFGGIISLAGGMCYAELGSIITKSGGERTYLAEAFGYRWGVVFTFSYVFIVKSITFAALSITTGNYFVEMFMPNCRGTEFASQLIAFTTLAIVFLINVVSVKLATKTQIIFTLTKLFALVMIIITGIVSMAKGERKAFKKPFHYEEFHPGKLGAVMINVLWSHEGWNGPGAIVGEMINPTRDLPLAIGGGVLTVMLLYTFTICAYIDVLGYNTVSSVRTVAILFAEKMYPNFSFIIPIFICCSAFGACNGGMLGVARVSLVSGIEGELPRMFALVHRVQRTPVISLFFLFLGSCVFVPTDFNTLLNYCAFVTWMFYFIVMVSLIYFKVKRTDLVHSFKVPIFVPVFVQLVSIFMVVMAFASNLVGCSIIFVIILAFFGMYWLPDHILKPKPLVQFHDRVCDHLMRWYNLTYADASDIS